MVLVDVEVYGFNVGIARLNPGSPDFAPRTFKDMPADACLYSLPFFPISHPIPIFDRLHRGDTLQLHLTDSIDNAAQQGCSLVRAPLLRRDSQSLTHRL